jgi:hypothetical protein
MRGPISSIIFAILANQVATLPVLAEPLTEQGISQFAQTWAPLTARLMTADPEFDPQNVTGVVSQLQQMVQTDGPDSVRDGAVSAHGYQNFETWSVTAIQIISAAQWAKDPVEAHDVDKAIAAIKSEENQTSDEKALLIADLQSAYETAQKQKPEQTDIDVTKRLLPLLEPILWPTQ